MTPFKGPNKGTSAYGYRKDPFGSGKQVWHGGYDSVATDGDWTVRETTGGTVIAASRNYNGGRGWMVKVQSGKAVVLTQHYDDIYVTVGQTVKQGDAIGLAGSTGDVTGRHLHFEVQVNGAQVDPSLWMGLPNTVETHPGNNDLDEWTLPTEPEQPPGPIVTPEGFTGTKPWLGIDVSKYQGTIDWPKVKAAGIQYALVRVGWAGYDGNIYNVDGQPPAPDECFHANMQGAIAAGIPVGVYVYSYCKTPQAAKLAAQKVLEYVKLYQCAMPIVFDYENAAQYASYGKEKNTAICKAFLDEIEAAGYYAMLYTYTYFAIPYLNMDALAKYDMWIADYRGYVGYPGAYGIWQYSSTGTVPGISGAVDMNRAYKDYPAIIRAAGLNGLKPGEPEKPKLYMSEIGPMGEDYKNELDAWGLERGLSVFSMEV